MTRNEQIIALKKTTDLSMSQIARQLGVSKNVVQGVITREGSTVVPHGGEPRTLYDRCDTLHAQMDAVLAATKDVPGLRIKGTGYQVPVTAWGMPRSLTRGTAHGNDLEREANRVSDEQYLRRRWRKLLPAMKAEVRRVAMEERSTGYEWPLKVGSLPGKGVPSPRDTVAKH